MNAASVEPCFSDAVKRQSCTHVVRLVCMQLVSCLNPHTESVISFPSSMSVSCLAADETIEVSQLNMTSMYSMYSMLMDSGWCVCVQTCVL